MRGGAPFPQGWPGPTVHDFMVWRKSLRRDEHPGDGRPVSRHQRGLLRLCLIATRRTITLMSLGLAVGGHVIFTS